MEKFSLEKFLFLFFPLMLMVCGLTACGATQAGKSEKEAKMENTSDIQDSETSEQTQEEHREPMQIVTTIFPAYDWVQAVLGDKKDGAEITMLFDNGVDLHSYQPTAEDILKISTCDLFIYVGGESDEWVEDALEEATNQEMIVINLLDALGNQVKEEELVEGMEGEEGEDEEPEYDEHVWLSLKNASVLVERIASAIAEIDIANASVYQENAVAYCKALDALDQQYQDVVSSSPANTLLFGDRFPFRYLVDDYGLSYYAAFVGCSAETEASFETVVFLAKKVDELSLHTILTMEGANQKIATTIRDNTKTKNQQILPMDSMQSMTSQDVANGVTYLSVMTDNLNVLKKALQ